MSDSQFLRNSAFDFLIPQDSDIDIEEALGTAESPADGDESNVLARIPQRALLYFDEALPIYVILRTPYHDDRSLSKFVPRLNVILEAQAFSAPTIATPNPDAPPPLQARDTIWTAKLDVTEDPVFVVVGSGEDDDGQDVLLIWKINAFLARPKVRLQAPAIIFQISAVLRPPLLEKAGTTEAYLPSGVSFALNVLEPLGEKLLIGGAHSSTTTSSTQALVSHQATGESLPVTTVARRPFRAIPALSSRVRFHSSPGAHSPSKAIAVLELDALKFGQHPVEVTKIHVSFVGGEEVKMLHGNQLQLPIMFESTDNLICLYALDSEKDSHNGQPSSVKMIDIAIDARVAISKNSRPKIGIRWRQNVDFTTLTDAANRPGRAMQRDVRPANIVTSEKKSLPKIPERESPFTGVTVTFSKSNTVYVGEPFSWEVSIINRTAQVRQFALAMLPKRPGVQQSRRTTRSTTLVGAGSTALAEAVVDENVLYATIKTHSAEATQLVCLSADTRTNLMYPGSIYSTEMEFLALTKGYLSMEAVRITDLETGEAVDIRDLPDVMAVDRTEHIRAYQP